MIEPKSINTLSELNELRMIERLLGNVLAGITLIEENTGIICSILAQQLGDKAIASGKSVLYLTTKTKENAIDQLKFYNFKHELFDVRVCHDINQLKDFEHDLIIIDNFSTLLFGKSLNEVVDVTELIRKAEKDFILVYDGRMLDEKVDAYVKSIADNYIFIKKNIVGERIHVYLYIPKLRFAFFDKLIKITVCDTGIMVDTRELIG